MTQKLKSGVFVVAMLVLTVAFAVIGTNANSKWRMLGMKTAVADASVDKKGCIFAAWEQQAGTVGRVAGCDQYEIFRAEKAGAALLAASETYDVDW